MSLLDQLRAGRVTAVHGPAIAESFVKKGFHVTPVAAPVYGVKKSGKAAGVGGRDEWWARACNKDNFDRSLYVDRNVGICGGYPLEGGGWLLVLDPDGDSGLSQLEALCAVYGPLPTTFTVRSGSGTGKHIYLRTKEQKGGRNLAGCKAINTRGKGGQVVAPGCHHASGGVYTIEVDAPIAWAPEWLETMLTAAREYVSAIDPDTFEPVEVTREMCRTEADRLGASHANYELLDKLANSEPVAAPGERHEIADLRGTTVLVGIWGPGTTQESVLRLLAPTYPGWSIDPLGPGEDLKNWIDVCKALDGAKLKWEKPLDVSRLTKAGQDKLLEDAQARIPEGFVADEKKTNKATRALKSAEKLVKSDPSQLENQAYLIGRYTPHVLSPEHVLSVLVKAAAFTNKAAYIDEAKATLLAQSGISRGQFTPHFAQHEGWRGKIRRNHEDAPIVCGANILAMLEYHPRTAGCFRFNVRKGATMLEYAPPWLSHHAEFPTRLTDADAYAAQDWIIGELGSSLGDEDRILKTMLVLGEKDKYDPFKDWLENLKWDETPRLNHWLTHACGVVDSDYHQLVGSKFLLQAIARTYSPGCTAQHVLVLVGDQGLGKSTAFKELAGAEYFCSNIGNIHDKDSIFNLEKYVIVELAELAAFKKADMEVIKRYISDSDEDLRRSYGRTSSQIQRRAIFGGTTNVKHFLQDETGNRRFWPVEVFQSINQAWLRENRDQLWAEALHRWKQGESWWPSTGKEVEICRSREDEFFDYDSLGDGLDIFERPHRVYGMTEEDRPKFGDPVKGQLNDKNLFRWVTVKQVHAQLETDYKSKTDQIRINKLARNRGWGKMKVRVADNTISAYKILEE